MSPQSNRLRPGDVVEVRLPNEIAETLDAEGTLDHLPFMPEMLEFCGRKFHVARRALTTCYFPDAPRGFDADNVATLEGVRCSGAAHDGCQKSCMIFWREEWLRKVDPDSVSPQVAPKDAEQLATRLHVLSDPETYYCQATALPKVTHSLSRSERLTRYLRGFWYGNFGILSLIRSLAIYIYSKILREKLLARGNRTSTPAEVLNLQPGEWVEVKPIKSIIETLDKRGCNRGLYFTSDMRLWCGSKLRVKGRLDKVISDGTGKMKQFKNTVCLEGSTCGCSYMGLGMANCCRCEFTYWREIWLQRCDK